MAHVDQREAQIIQDYVLFRLKLIRQTWSSPNHNADAVVKELHVLSVEMLCLARLLQSGFAQKFANRIVIVDADVAAALHWFFHENEFQLRLGLQFKNLFMQSQTPNVRVLNF